MARAPAAEPVLVAPSNNIYTVLAAAGSLALIFALVTLFLRANALGVELLKF